MHEISLGPFERDFLEGYRNIINQIETTTLQQETMIADGQIDPQEAIFWGRDYLIYLGEGLTYKISLATLKGDAHQIIELTLKRSKIRSALFSATRKRGDYSQIKQVIQEIAQEKSDAASSANNPLLSEAYSRLSAGLKKLAV